MSQIVVEDLTAESVAPVTSAEPETTAPKREVSEAAKAALKEYQEASKKAKAFLAEVILGKHPQLVLPNEVLEAIRVLVPIRNAKQGHAAPRNAKQQVLDKLLDLFMANDGKVTLMQVIKRIVPPIGNEIITLVKDTSLVRVIAVYEIMWNGERFIKQGIIWPLFFTGVYYLLFSGILTLLFGKLEKKLDYFKV